jgi:hypothetical protein
MARHNHAHQSPAEAVHAPVESRQVMQAEPVAPYGGLPVAAVEAVLRPTSYELRLRRSLSELVKTVEGLHQDVIGMSRAEALRHSERASEWDTVARAIGECRNALKEVGR